MNISLIYPTQIRKKGQRSCRRCWPPLGLAYLASVLEKDGHNVQIIDRYILQEKNNFDLSKTNAETVNLVSNFNTELVGVTSTTPDVVDAIEILEMIKEHDSSITTVLGGPHVTAAPVETLNSCVHIDMCVTGEGERTICEIASGRQLSQICGIYYKENGGIAQTGPRALIRNLDALPFPAWHLLNMKFYTRPSRFISRNSFPRATSIFTSRGCPFKCNFCAGPVIFPGVRFHSPERVINEIDKLITDYSIEYICFADDMFLAKKSRAYEILRLFESTGIYKRIKWYAQIRPDIIDRELLTYMKKMGCDRVEFGFESGSERVLELMNKKSSVEKSFRAASIAKQVGIHFQGNFIIGYPGETEKDLFETVNFMKTTRPAVIMMNIYWPLPGTVSYDLLRKKGEELPMWEDTDRATETRLNYSEIPDERFFELHNWIKLRIVIPNNFYYLIRDTMFHPVVLFKLFKEHFYEYFKRISMLVISIVSSKVRISILKASVNLGSKHIPRAKEP